jgi:hypothetical protein
MENVPLRHVFPLKVVPLIEVLLYTFWVRCNHAHLPLSRDTLYKLAYESIWLELYTD